MPSIKYGSSASQNRSQPGLLLHGMSMSVYLDLQQAKFTPRFHDLLSVIGASNSKTPVIKMALTLLPDLLWLDFRSNHLFLSAWQGFFLWYINPPCLSCNHCNEALGVMSKDSGRVEEHQE